MESVAEESRPEVMKDDASFPAAELPPVVTTLQARWLSKWMRAGFAVSVICMVAGVALHVAEYSIKADKKGFLPPNATVGKLELGGMVMVTLGTISAGLFMFSFYDVAALQKERKKVVFTPAYFELLHNAEWTPAHTKICWVMLLAITIDLMKPATLGFIMPGLLAEYKLTKTQGAILPTLAISGTTMGSIIWGFMADRVGRRYSILLSTVLFVSTSICGAMPNFTMNVFMCWLMGVSVGGLIPVAVSLLSEVVPSRVRTKALITILAAGSAFGYLAASGCSYLLQTYFAWRTLWFVGIPTGLLMLPLCLEMPESFRFLVVAGREEDACKSLALYFGIKCTPETLREFYQESEPLNGPRSGEEESDQEVGGGGEVELSPTTPNPASVPRLCLSPPLLSSPRLFLSPTDPPAADTAGGAEAATADESSALYKEYWERTVPLTSSMSFLALSWGLCNYGFVTYVPTMLTSGTGTIKPQVANSLIFYSSCASVAFVPLYIYLYGFFSSRWALASMAWWELIMFFIFALSYQTILTNETSFSVWYTFFLGSHNAVLAMITVYSAENFTTKMRGRGTGMVSAASRIAGVFAPYSITSILTFGAPWQMSVAVGVPLLVGAAFFTRCSHETSDYDSDNTATVFSPVGPLYEEQEAFLDPTPRNSFRGQQGAGAGAGGGAGPSAVHVSA